MSTPVVYNGSSYNVPAYQDTGYAQGPGNLSSYLIALATGSLTLAGGSFPLTADANFGSSFGLLAKYFSSISTPIATTGVFRLANAETISWRNATDGGNISMSINASDQFQVGADIITPAGQGFVVTSPDGLHTYRLFVDNNGEFSQTQLT